MLMIAACAVDTVASFLSVTIRSRAFRRVSTNDMSRVPFAENLLAKPTCQTETLCIKTRKRSQSYDERSD
jgi:hypothetical protein